jgi:hypothetical protein
MHSTFAFQQKRAQIKHTHLDPKIVDKVVDAHVRMYIWGVGEGGAGTGIGQGEGGGVQNLRGLGKGSGGNSNTGTGRGGNTIGSER